MKPGGDYTSANVWPWRTMAILIAAAALTFTACAGPQATAGTIEIHVQVGDRLESASVPAGSTVQEALRAAGAQVDELDRVAPPSYTVLTEGSVIVITRVEERFETEQSVVAFERQTIRSESIPEGETRLIQPGVNGLEEVTYRILQEQGQEVSRTAVRRLTVVEPQAEIVMVGAKSSFASVEFEGRLIYVSGGNAFLMRRSSESRTPIVTSGDLDGRVLSLSADSEWLAFSRAGRGSNGSINSLWVTRLTDPEFEALDLEIENVIHFADWAPTPGVRTLAFSTVEPRPAAPGWQANNNLGLIRLSAAGTVLSREELIPPNPGGQYGWWGIDFVWASDGLHLAFARPDGVGTIDTRQAEMEELVDIVPLQTMGDWAWVPGLSWGSQDEILYFGQHAPPLGIEPPATSPIFHLSALLPGGVELALVEGTGMFNQPSAAPPSAQSDRASQPGVAFLQALSPLESAVSAYRVYVIDRDGSNLRALFPPDGEPGLRGDDLKYPPVWSPDGTHLAVVYRGDLWLVEVASGQGHQLTGDGQVSALDWVP